MKTSFKNHFAVYSGKRKQSLLIQNLPKQFIAQLELKFESHIVEKCTYVNNNEYSAISYKYILLIVLKSIIFVSSTLFVYANIN